jgi:hypothetical protein
LLLLSGVFRLDPPSLTVSLKKGFHPASKERDNDARSQANGRGSIVVGL